MEETIGEASGMAPSKIQEPDTTMDTPLSVFKFKKAKKLLGGVEISSVKKWIMMLKKEYQGDTLFRHYCLYRDKEFETVTGIHVFEGFMKGERFVVTRNRMLNNKGFNDFNVLTRLNEEMERIVREGYLRDESQYFIGEPGNPSYFKDPEEQVSEDEEEDNSPEADLKKAAEMLTKKKNTLLSGLNVITKNLTLAHPGQDMDENGNMLVTSPLSPVTKEAIEGVKEESLETVKTSIQSEPISLFTRKKK